MRKVFAVLPLFALMAACSDMTAPTPAPTPAAKPPLALNVVKNRPEIDSDVNADSAYIVNLVEKFSVSNMHISEGTACEVDAGLCGSLFGNDHLVVSWNAEYARFLADLRAGTLHGSYEGAWLRNHWSGMMPGASGVEWQYTFVWTGAVCPVGVTLPDGGICWGAGLELYMSQGIVDGGHFWMAHASHSYKY